MPEDAHYLFEDAPKKKPNADVINDHNDARASFTSVVGGTTKLTATKIREINAMSPAMFVGADEPEPNNLPNSPRVLGRRLGGRIG